MIDLQMMFAFTLIGFVLGAVGGLGAELLDSFIGRSLEAFCRLRGRRERFGDVLDRQEDAMRGAEYLRIIGTVLFLISGTIFVSMRYDQDPSLSDITGNDLVRLDCLRCFHRHVHSSLAADRRYKVRVRSSPLPLVAFLELPVDGHDASVDPWRDGYMVRSDG